MGVNYRFEFHKCSQSFIRAHTRSYHTVIRVYDESGNVIETYEHSGKFNLSGAPVSKTTHPGQTGDAVQSGLTKISDFVAPCLSLASPARSAPTIT